MGDFLFVFFKFELVLSQSGSTLSKYLPLHGYVINVKKIIKISRIINCPSRQWGGCLDFFGPFFTCFWQFRCYVFCLFVSWNACMNSFLSGMYFSVRIWWWSCFSKSDTHSGMHSVAYY